MKKTIFFQKLRFFFVNFFFVVAPENCDFVVNLYSIDSNFFFFGRVHRFVECKKMSSAFSSRFTWKRMHVRQTHSGQFGQMSHKNQPKFPSKLAFFHHFHNCCVNFSIGMSKFSVLNAFFRLDASRFFINGVCLRGAKWQMAVKSSVALQKKSSPLLLSNILVERA